MKIMQVGLGEYGWRWFADVLLPCEDAEIVGLIDRDEEKLARAGELGKLPASVLFAELGEALLGAARPDFILNAAPPDAHADIVRLAVAARIPVLCEQPIAASLKQAAELALLACESRVPVAIAADYRYRPLVREAKRLLPEIGRLRRIDIDFRRKHEASNYHASLKHPLLLDVAIHHLDLLRYLTGQEAISVTATAWRAPESWYAGFADAVLVLVTEERILATYRGSLDTPKNATDWLGNWRFEGEEGQLTMGGGRLEAYAEDGTLLASYTPDEQEDGDGRAALLASFMHELEAGTTPETDIADGIRTFGTAMAAIEAAERRRTVSVSGGFLEPEKRANGG